MMAHFYFYREQSIYLIFIDYYIQYIHHIFYSFHRKLKDSHPIKNNTTQISSTAKREIVEVQNVSYSVRLYIKKRHIKVHVY